MNPLDSMPKLMATNITTVTLLGVWGDFPLKSGNCFGVKGDDNKYYQILNFVYENIKHLMATTDLTFPVKIIKYSDNTALIADIRIPREYYRNRFCSTCTPRDLLPPNQRLMELLDIESGKRIEHENGGISFKLV